MEELADSIRMISNISSDEAKKIAESGYKTACGFTDSAVAQKYLESIEHWN